MAFSPSSTTNSGLERKPGIVGLAYLCTTSLLTPPYIVVLLYPMLDSSSFKFSEVRHLEQRSKMAVENCLVANQEPLSATPLHA